MKHLCLTATVLAMVLAAGPGASAATIVAEFSEQTWPANPQNSFSAFAFADFAAAGAVVDGPNSLIFDIAVDGDSLNGLFGGAGVDFGPFVAGMLQPLDFDPLLSSWEMRVRKLPGNRASTVNALYRDSDPATSAENYVFNFDLAGVPNDGEFHIITVAATNFAFVQTALGSPDGVNNPGLNQIQIQSVFGAAERLNIEVDYLRILTVPEPASAVAWGLGAMVLACRRRRTAKNIVAVRRSE